MGDMPRNRHGLIPMLVAIRLAPLALAGDADGHERKRREAEAAGRAPDGDPPETPKKKKKRGWFG